MTRHDDGFDPAAEITEAETGEVLGTVSGLAHLAFGWADSEPGQTGDLDELRLHLLSEHSWDAALGLTDDQARKVHTNLHGSGQPVGHPASRVTWNEDKIIELTVERSDDATLASRWNAHCARLERAHGGPLWTRPQPEIPEPDPAIYVHAPVGENAASELAVLAIVRERLAAHFAWHPPTALAAVDVVDELAREVVAENTDDDPDEEIGEAEHDG